MQATVSALLEPRASFIANLSARCSESKVQVDGSYMTHVMVLNSSALVS